MSNKTILVTCATDSNLADVEFSVPSLQKVYGQTVDMAIATYGDVSVSPSVVLREYSAKNKLKFFDAPRQDFVSLDEEIRCCEVIGQLTVSRHFYDSGYEEVYLLHPDMYHFRDALSYYRKFVNNHWNFTTIFWHLFKCDVTFKQAVEWGSKKTFKKHKVTLPVAFITYSKAFVEYLFSEYLDEKDMWDEVFYKFQMTPDICLFDVAKAFPGWSPRIIGRGGSERDFVMVDGGMLSMRPENLTKRHLLNIVAKNPTICFVHNRIGTALLR